MTNIIEIQQEIKKELGNKDVLNALVATTFKGLDTKNIYLAAQEGMMRGFTFKDFLEKNVYAIPFKTGYSLVTSIDYARKVGMRSGVVGKSAPDFAEKDGKVIACTITVRRKIGEYVGDYSATVFFDEYNTGRNQWASKPRTMLAKVAEMHALRMACPEELSQMYTADEMGEETQVIAQPIDTSYMPEIDAITTVEALKEYYLKNKGKGKDFDKYVTKRKKELQNENS